jgi:Domain of unknown function (DUF4258)
MAWPEQQPAKLSPADAIRLVRELAADSGRVGLTHHCRQRMQERDITLRQILNCLQKGAITEGPAIDIYGNWKMDIYRRADDLTCAVAIQWRARLVVITVF